MSYKYFSAFRSFSFYDLLPSFKPAECKADEKTEQAAQDLHDIF